MFREDQNTAIKEFNLKNRLDFSSIFLSLAWFLQNLLLSLPKLPFVLLATDKVRQFLRVWHYLSRANIKGDYLEFGVFEGMGFNVSLRSAAKFFKKGSDQSPRFFAFDSFQGLPELHQNYDGKGVFEKGTYFASLSFFKRNVLKASKGWVVKIIPGFFDQSLTNEVIITNHMESAAFVNIDCDLYDSTITALRFVTPLLKTGSVIYFDDWYFSNGDMKLGEAGACAKWISENPRIKLVDFGNVAVMGKLFIVNID